MSLKSRFIRGISFRRKSKKDDKTLVPHILCLNIGNGNLKALNLTTGLWKDLPCAKLSANDSAFIQRKVVEVGNEIYCLDRGKVLKFEKSAKKWIKKKSRSKQMSRSIEVAVVQKHTIYVIARDVTGCYDVVEDRWKKNLPGCQLHGLFCAASSDKFIYTMGGIRNGRTTAAAKQFELETQSFSQIPAMKTARSAASAAVFHEMVYVVGGFDGRQYLNSVEFYQPLTKTWTELTKNTCVRRYLASVCVANNRFYVVGGARYERGEILNPNSIELYDKDSNEWNVVMKYNWRIGFTPCCAINLLCSKKELI